MSPLSEAERTLPPERRGGRSGGDTLMLVRSVGKDQRPWNKGMLIGQKKPLEPKHVWSIRVRLEIARSLRDLVIFNLAIDSKLRACDLVKLRFDDICSGAKVRHRATIIQKKTCVYRKLKPGHNGDEVRQGWRMI
jgi:hypothetical protein